ncbi:hypothetical protein BGZ99_009642 [Dissophora globulifera]|uniref:Uncharacterized protein n=1 Tax=Dissophora globulifera TaxID=979702 RepID=A0A9P6R3Z6_9FUNG|nr:hypothetical protein BGZ99_009642 [Dissophora globulifera]
MSPKLLLDLELENEYIKLAAQGVDLDEHRITTLKAIHDSLSSKSSKIYRSLRGATAAVVPLGGTIHTALTGRSYARKCVLAYGLAGSAGNSDIAKEVAEEILIHMGLGVIADVTGAVIPGASSILAARSAPKVMDQVLEAVHKRADDLHIAVIQRVKAMPPSPAPSNDGF